jgi:type IV fimbrial biogenesis protein FimT
MSPGKVFSSQIAHTPLMKYSRGVTLVEMLVTMVIAVILATLAAPSFVSLIRDFSVSTHVNALNADIRYARSEAIKRGVSVSLCPSADSLNANPTCSGSDWATGWIVFVDTNANGSRSTTASDNEIVMRRQESVAQSSSGIRGAGGTTVASLRFNSDGRIPGGANNLEFTATGGEFTRLLCIGVTGRPHAAQKGATSC